ncbi:S9 family peptidase [Zooshikella ganghwensis]|uniref:S9 family peptidase n=1 Tax=Zooshikella ganghwensis TaxID=202772 RepID=A0A4P9VLR3_9GAMM|nr:S9 family peptidase [Zooshikella ganghwensis]RDH43499.1 S9 family peptidase [Zooshikella ganghwensis]
MQTRQQIIPPQAKREDYFHTHSTAPRFDPYHWLKQTSLPDTQAYLNAENDYAAFQMADSEALQTLIYQQSLARIVENDRSAAYTWGPYQYYSESRQGSEYAFYYRQYKQQPPELLLDGNQVAASYDYCEIGSLAISPDHKFLVYSIDTAGDEQYQLIIKNLSTQEEITLPHSHTSGDVTWTMDAKGFYYTTLNHLHRTDRLFYHSLGSNMADDPLLFTEDDEQFYVSVYRSQSDQLIFIETSSQESTEVFFLPADSFHNSKQFNQQLCCIAPRQPDHEYYVDHNGLQLIILTNDQHENYRLVRADCDSPQPAHWQPLIPPKADTTLEDYLVFRHHIALLSRTKDLLQLSIWHDDKLIPVTFPDPIAQISFGDNVCVDTQHLRIHYETFIQPEQVLDIDLNTLHRTCIKTQEVKGGYHPEHYRCQRDYITTEDGEQIPLTLIGKQQTWEHPAPILLQVYGAYGHSLDPEFSISRLNLLDRGMLIGFAHVRGGGDCGEHWYRQGKQQHKLNTFTDFMLCVEHLFKARYTDPQQLMIVGRSAGGMVIGYALNNAPQYFKGAIMDVPFVDCLNTMLDESLPLTIAEYDEWGNPASPEVYQRIKSYAPYENIKPQAYPTLLVQAGFHDTRVHIWEPAKWVAALRYHNTGDQPIIFKTSFAAGHGGASGRYEALQEMAFEQAFILKTLQLE